MGDCVKRWDIWETKISGYCWMIQVSVLWSVCRLFCGHDRSQPGECWSEWVWDEKRSTYGGSSWVNPAAFVLPLPSVAAASNYISLNISIDTSVLSLSLSHTHTHTETHTQTHTHRHTQTHTHRHTHRNTHTDTHTHTQTHTPTHAHSHEHP
jgi:hypothetical protein